MSRDGAATLLLMDTTIVAQMTDGRLQLLRANGEEVFRGTEIGHEPLMESFAPDDARAFAKRAREARAKLRH